MGARVINQTILDNLIVQLEFLVLKAENEVVTLEKVNNDYKYIEDLIEVINKRKIAFAEGFFNLSRDKEKEFKEIVSRIISEEELKRLIEELKNLFYLKENNLYEEKSANSQRIIAENKINQFLGNLKMYNARIDYQKNEKEKVKLNEHIKKIINLANKLDLKEEIKDIDFFAETLETVDLSDYEKKEIIKFYLSNNISHYVNKSEVIENLDDYDEVLDCSFEDEKEAYLEEIACQGIFIIVTEK